MCATSPKRILNLLSPGPGLLGTIINQIQLIQQLSQALEALLPPALQPHCRVAAVNQRTLVVHTDSAAWATRLRYLAPVLTASLRDQSGYPWVRDIDVKVRPVTEPTHGNSPHTAPARGPREQAASPGGAPARRTGGFGSCDASGGPSS